MIHLIPTFQPSKIFLTKHLGLMHEEYPDKTVNAGNQFLVITDNSKFKAGDFVLLGLESYPNRIHQMTENDMVDYLDSGSDATKKIVASNSTKITPKSIINDVDVKRIIEYYNTNNKTLPTIKLVKNIQAFDEQHRKIDYAMIEGDYTKSSLKIVNGNEVVIDWFENSKNEPKQESFADHIPKAVTLMDLSNQMFGRTKRSKEATKAVNEMIEEGLSSGKYVKTEGQDGKGNPITLIDFSMSSPEEEAKRLYPDKTTAGYLDHWSRSSQTDFIAGAKWQEKRMFAPEEVQKMIQAIYSEFAELDRSRYFPHELKRIIQLEVEQGIKPIKIFK